MGEPFDFDELDEVIEQFANVDLSDVEHLYDIDACSDAGLGKGQTLQNNLSPSLTYKKPLRNKVSVLKII